jgi:hypothetical protein
MGETQAFVVTLSNWHWASATEVPGTATLNAGGSAELAVVSCRKVGASRPGVLHPAILAAGPTGDHVIGAAQQG